MAEFDVISGNGASEAERAKQAYIQRNENITRTAAGVAVEITIPSIDDKSWQDLGNCLGTDPDLFFPERGASTKEAKEVCVGCVVREDCLEYALANGEKFGIWGGLSERERRRIRRQRLLARAATAAASRQAE